MFRDAEGFHDWLEGHYAADAELWVAGFAVAFTCMILMRFGL